MDFNNKKTKMFAKVTSLLLVMVISLSSCDFEYDIAEAYSIEDETAPVAGFTYTQSTDDGENEWKKVFFGNTSSSATVYTWSFGEDEDAFDADQVEQFEDQEKELEPVYQYDLQGLVDEDTDTLRYTVTLESMDDLGVISTYSEEIELIRPLESLVLDPGVLNGDFTDGWDDWQFDSFTSGTTSPFNSSSDGSPLLYDGTESGSTKTPGAKWTGSTSAGSSLSGNTRYAYQPLVLTPNADYIVEFTYAIKTDKDDIDGGDRAIIEVLDGQFSDGANAVASSNAGTLARIVGAVANGKGDFKVETATFTANATGEVSIMIYAITNDELYVDNVKITPAN